MKPLMIYAAMILMIGSCKKADSLATYEIKCTIDGVQRTFNEQCIAGRQMANGFTAINIGGGAKAGLDETFGFIIINQPSAKAIVAGTYVDNSTDFEILSTYSLGASGPDYEAGSTVRDEFVSAGATLQSPFKVTITSITNETMTGTFSGDFYLNGSPGQPKRSITNGSFNLKFF